MMIKVLLVLMLCGATVVAGDEWIVCEDGVVREVDSTQIADAVWRPLWSAVTAIGLLPKHDTTRNYIKEIKQKCDTVYEAIGGHDCTKCPKCGTPPITFFADITCIDDTVWAPKVQVWLTPERLDELLDIIKEREQVLDRKWKRALRGLTTGEAPPKKLKE